MERNTKIWATLYILAFITCCVLMQVWYYYQDSILVNETLSVSSPWITPTTKSIAKPKVTSKKNIAINKVQLEFVHITKTGGTSIEYNGAKYGNVTWGRCHWHHRSPTLPACHNGRYRINDRTRKPQQYFIIYQPSSKNTPYYQYRTPKNHYIEKSFEMWHVPPSWLRPQYSPYVDREEIIYKTSKENGNDRDDDESNDIGNEIMIIQKRLFTIVRNPYTRMISEFYCPYLGYDRIAFRDPHFMNPFTNETTKDRWKRKKSMKHNNNNQNHHRIMLSAKKKTKKITIDAFNDWIQKRLQRKPILSTGHYVPQYEYVYDTSTPFGPSTSSNKETPPLRQVVHHILRYENLTEEFNELMLQYNITNIRLSNDAVIVNQNSKHSTRYTVDELYDTTIHRINEFYYYDFLFFNYTMIQPSPTTKKSKHQIQTDIKHENDKFLFR